MQAGSASKTTCSGTEGERAKPVQPGQVRGMARRSEPCSGSACKAGRLPGYATALPCLPPSISKDEVLNTDLQDILKLITKVALQNAEFAILTEHRHWWQSKEASHSKHSLCVQTVTAEKYYVAAIAYLRILLQLFKPTLQAADSP